jgi:hypothetical protein
MSPIAFIRQNFLYLLYFLLAANLIVINKMSEHEEMLKSKWSPYGIVSLGLSFSQPGQDSILRAWDSTYKGFIFFGSGCTELRRSISATQAADRQINNDYYFIFFYISLLCVLFIRLYPENWRPLGFHAGIGLILIGGLFDAAGNFFISEALHDHQVAAWQIWLPSTVKWGLLLIICAFLVVRMFRHSWFRKALQKISFYLTGTATLIFKFRIVVLGLAVLFLALWTVDQGRDLLLIINSHKTGPIAFLIAISVLAVLNWYLPKLYISETSHNVSILNFIRGRWRVSSIPRHKDSLDGARLMGTLTFLIPAACMLNAMRIFGIPYLLDDIHPLILLAITLGFYQIALVENWISDKFAPNGTVNKERFFLLAGVIFVFIILLGFFQENVQPDFLGMLALELFLLSFVFLVFATIRTCNWGNLQPRISNMTPFVILPGMFFLFIFLLANIRPELFFFNEKRRLLTLPMVICAICFYSILFTYLLLAGRRRNIRFLTLLIIVGLVISSVFKNPYHQVRMLHTKNNYPSMDSLHQYIASWLLKRRAEIDSFNLRTNDSFPVFIVNAYGGGIRAAAWTTMLISKLDQRFVDSGSKPFQHYVLAYSGASGGTIGLSLLCASRYYLAEIPSTDTWKSFYENDFLTPMIIGLLGRDAWNSSFDQHISPDRSVLQEKVWEKRLREIGIKYDSAYVSYWDSSASPGKYEVPLLFSNTYDIDSGLKAIVAPVHLSHLQFPGTIFVEDLLQQDTDALKLSTGAFLSARFPYISPTGKIDDFHHFMDGGLKENSGAETSREIMEVFDKTIKKLSKSDSIYKKVKVIMLSIPNTILGTDSLQTAANLYELTAPLTALMNNWVGNTRKADTVNAKNIDAYYHHHYYQLRPVGVCVDNFKPVLPLGWQISDYALDQMESSLDTIKPNLDAIIRIVKPAHGAIP